MSAFGDQELDLILNYRSFMVFYPEYPVAVVKIKVDLALGKDLLEKVDDIPGSQLVLHIGLEDFYNFHIDNCC
jgi:hypothetical protein